MHIKSNVTPNNATEDFERSWEQGLTLNATINIEGISIERRLGYYFGRKRGHYVVNSCFVVVFLH